MGLFSKGCVVCGDAVKTLSGKKISDGTLCKECNGKLSPWFTGYNQATAETIVQQIEAREKNRERLKDFNLTKAWGIKKYKTAYQFIYDEEKRIFVIVEGPEESFKEKNPDIIDFSQVKDVILEVKEDWSEKDGQYVSPRSTNWLPQNKYDDVFWRYDFYLHIIIDHPYLSEICYKMNFKTTVMKVPQRMFCYRRGLEMNGEFKREALAKEAVRIEAMIRDEGGSIKKDKVIDALTGANKDKGIMHGVVSNAKNDLYLKYLDNIAKHVRRAERISKLLLG